MHPRSPTEPLRVHDGPIRTCFDWVVALAVLFPFVGVVPGIDIQPNFALAGFATVLLVLLLRPQRGVGRVSLQLLGVCGLLLSVRFLVGQNGLNPRYVATYVLALGVPFLMWHLVWRGRLLVASRLLWAAIFIYVAVGAVQLMVEPKFLAWMVPRSVEDIDALVATGRGVRSLASEPAAFGKVLAYLNVLYIFFSLWPAFDRERARKVTYGSIFLFGANLLLAQSAYAIAVHMVILAVALWFVDRRGLFVAALGVIGVLGVLLFVWAGGSRLLLIAKAVFSLNLEFLMRQGAFARLMNVPISIYGGLQTFPFGFGNSDLVIPGQLDFFGSTYAFMIGKRNVGGFVELFLRFGVVGLVVLAIYGIALWRIAKMRAVCDGLPSRVGIFFAFALVLLTFLDGSSADPLAWFTLAVILRGALTAPVPIALSSPAT